MKRFITFLLLCSAGMFAGCSSDEPDEIQTVLATITGVTPSRVSLGQRGGQGTITGTNFTAVSAVSLGDGITVDSFNTVSANQIDVRFSVANNASPGQRTISVTNNAGTANSTAGLLQVLNKRAPEAVIDIDPPAGSKRTKFTMSAKSSTDDGKLNQFLWNFGDNTTASGKVVEKQYDAIGTYEVSLQVKDNDEATATTSIEIEVLENSPPVARIAVEGGTKGSTSSPFFFSGEDSFDPDGRVVSLLWDFGDRSRKATGEKVSHKYNKEGNFTASLVVTDNKGQDGLETVDLRVEKSREVQCPGRGKQIGGDRHIDIISYNRPFAVFRPLGGGNCSSIFYKCGDIRQGGITIPVEYWYGTICAMWDRGDGTFRAHLVRGNHPVELHKRETYLHAQGCGGGFCN